MAGTADRRQEFAQDQYFRRPNVTMICYFLATRHPAPDSGSVDDTSAVPARRFSLLFPLPKGFFETGVMWGLLLPLLSACSLTGVYTERVTKSFEERCAPKETRCGLFHSPN